MGTAKLHAGGTRRTVTLLVMAALFVALWLPRTVGLGTSNTADERKWLTRAANLVYAVDHRDWAQTLQREHPAVTVLWAGALGVLQHMPTYAAAAPGYFGSDDEEMEAWLVSTDGPSPRDLLTAGRWWAALGVSLALALCYLPLRRLVGAVEAAVVLLLVGWAPFAVALSQQVQPDGLVASLSLAALIFFLSWLYAGQRRRDLIGAGVLMGLAWLTKTPAALLAPTGALLIALELWRGRRARANARVGDPPPPSARSLWMGFVAWGIVATVTFVLLWPAMWVDPFGTLARMTREMTTYVEGHSNPNYFLGRVVDDPGPMFYPVAFLFRTTPASLVGLVMAAMAAMRRLPPFDRPLVRRTALGFTLFAVVFLAMMSVPAKKFDRYILPTHLALDAVAALGWIALAQLAAAWSDTTHRARARTVFAGVLVIGVVFLHGVFTARHYPYYLTYFNPLVGGSRTAPGVLLVGWGEGLDEVGAWLNTQPDARNRVAVGWYARGPLSYYFVGRSVGLIHGSRMPWLDADFAVLYENQSQRKIPNAAAVDYLLAQKPDHVVSFRGLELARVYDLRQLVAELLAAAPPPQPVAVTAAWPDFRMSALATLPTLERGQALPVQASFEPPPEAGFKLSLRLASRDGTLVAQKDAKLTAAVDTVLFVPPDAQPGVYDLSALVYVDDESLEPVADRTGQDLVPLTSIEVGAVHSE